jgi:hypothetical protein
MPPDCITARDSAFGRKSYNEGMKRRHFLLLPAAAAHAAETKAESLRGRLQVDEPPAILTADGRRVLVDGDAQVRGALRDKRLAGADFEVVGRFDEAGVFQAAPIHENPLFVHKDGKRLFVTYWCDVCAIRTRTPGICWCCQEETELDLRERKD